MQVTDHWMEFLEKRMLVIQGALHEGKSITEIERLIGVDSTQVRLLCIEGRKRNAEAQKATSESGES